MALCDKFVSDLRQVGGFILGTPVSCNNKSDHHDTAELLLKLALNTITLTLLKNDNKNLYNIICLHLYYKGKAKRFLKFQITKLKVDHETLIK